MGFYAGLSLLLPLVSACEAEEKSVAYPPAGIYSFYREGSLETNDQSQPMLAFINKALADKGLDQLTTDNDDICFPAFIVKDQKGIEKAYYLDVATLKREFRIVYEEGEESQCTYDPQRSMETCERDSGETFYTFYNGNDFTQTFWSPDAGIPQPGPNDFQKLVRCDAYRDVLLNVSVKGKVSDQPEMVDTTMAALIRAAVKNPAVLDVVKAIPR